MFASCADPKTLEGLAWLLCYLSSGKHLLFYLSFGTVILLLLITAPIALLFGFGGALAARSRITPLRWFGKIYTSMVRGVPDIIFFLFVPIALDQPFEPVPGLRVTAFAVPGKVALYLEDGEPDTQLMGEQTIGLRLESGGRRMLYIPGCATVPDGLLAEMAAADLILFDGTVWQDDEMKIGRASCRERV